MNATRAMRTTRRTTVARAPPSAIPVEAGMRESVVVCANGPSSVGACLSARSGEDGCVATRAAWRAGRGHLLLVVLVLDVDTPDVVRRAGHDVLDGQHRRVHGVVLVVVGGHA